MRGATAHPVSERQTRLNSQERHEARYQRRKAAREEKRRSKLKEYDDFDRLSSIPSLLHANWDARKGVMFKASVARYNMNYYRNAVRQSRDLRDGKDICRPFYAFDICERGKLRHIHSLHYPERVIRRSACINTLVPVLSNGLIYDNGASLKGKGVSFSEKRCETHLHEFFRETGGNNGYVLIIDFKGYFDHILHDKLKEIISCSFYDTRIVRLCHRFINATNADKSPENKGRGLYIGPEDSQIYAVAYPNRIDHIIKDELRQKYYARYMDDSYIIHKDKAALQKIRDRLFVEYAKYGIIPNPKKTQIVKLSQGFTYLKTRYYLTETGKVVRKADHSSIVRERKKLKKMHRLYTENTLTLEQVTQSYMSWRGSIIRRDAYHSIEHMDTLFYELYGCKPWRNTRKKRGNRNERKTRSDHGRNHSLENVAA